MRATVMIWIFCRCLRWLLWIAAAGYYLEFALNRADHTDWNRQLLLTTELWMFGLPIAAVLTGFLELIARERNGFSRPGFGQDWLGRMSRQPVHAPRL